MVVRFYVLAAVLFSSCATAGGVDDYFRNGVLGIEWGSTRQQVQTAYPNGRTTPHSGGVIGYAIPGGMRILKVDVPVSEVRFQFTRANVLERVYIDFNYSERDLVLYGVAEALGQDYVTEEREQERIYKWKRGQSSLAVLEVGKEPTLDWVILVVDPVTESKRPQM
jgi:hypothetical protein